MAPRARRAFNGTVTANLNYNPGRTTDHRAPDPLGLDAVSTVPPSLTAEAFELYRENNYLQAVIDRCPSHEPARLLSANTAVGKLREMPADASSGVAGLGPGSWAGAEKRVMTQGGQRPVSSQVATTVGSTANGKPWRNTLVTSLASTQAHNAADILRSGGPKTVKAQHARARLGPNLQRARTGDIKTANASINVN